MNSPGGPPRERWLWAGLVFLVVFVADWAVVAAAGTDVPFHDQWDAHGQRLLPAVADGSLRLSELWSAHSEHRIVWTNVLAALLFHANGQWDPLVEMLALGLLRALVAALVFALATGGTSRLKAAVAAGAVMLGFAPLAAWHNVLWGFQTSVPFVLGFGLLALCGLSDPLRRPIRLAWGTGAALAAALAMGPGMLLAGALLPVLLLERCETGRWPWRGVVALALIATFAVAVVPAFSGAEPLVATTSSEFWRALGHSLGWPHTGQPWAALLVNAPLALAVGARVLRRRRPAVGENFVTAVALWVVLMAFASAWRRGGSAEWMFGTPSRYADLLVLLPLANLWLGGRLVTEALPPRRSAAWLLAVAWALFVLVGWAGLSREMLTRIVVPRARDREAPVRLMHAYQLGDDPRVFAGQPRLLVPHPNLAVVSSVLHDPRLQGRLPPSLQPERPLGPLSRLVRHLRPDR